MREKEHKPKKKRIKKYEMKCNSEYAQTVPTFRESLMNNNNKTIRKIYVCNAEHAM